MKMTERDEAQQKRAATTRFAAWAAVVAAAAALGMAAGLCFGGGPGWFIRGLASRTSLVCLAVALACLAILVVTGRAMWRAGLPQRLHRKGAGHADDRGTAMLEFAMVLPITLMLVLIMVQSTMLMTGNLCVHYAAYCAARTAIVAVPDGVRQPDAREPVYGETPNFLESWRSSAAEGGSDKSRRIWQAAIWAVLPVSCSSPQIPQAEAGSLTAGLERFFSGYDMPTPWWADSVLARKLRYAEDHTAIEVSSPAGGWTYAKNEDVTVTVEHVFYLSVPYASRVFARVVGGQELSFGAGEYGTLIKVSCTLTNEGVQDYVERELLPG